MKPIQVKINGHIQKTSQEICTEFLNTDLWPEFKGYSILPGIQSARFDVKTPQWVGSRIHVNNADGSSHVEEIIEWDVQTRIALKFQGFSAPLHHLATHFIEIWEFQNVDTGCNITRTMAFHPKGLLGWLILLPISGLMKKAFEKNLNQTTQSKK